MTLSILSRSKINLYLKIRKQRPDRYHELETLFLPLDNPADRIMLDFSVTPGIRVSSSLAGLPENLENLAGRAAKAYADATGIVPAWSIRIQKGIPVAAGMGGGSSDAAAVLQLLNRHYRKLSQTELASLALTIGADVPFFLHGRAAIATGIGEVFHDPSGELYAPPLLIVNPQFPVGAKWAYMNLDPKQIGEEPSGKLQRLIHALRSNDPKGIADNLHNDLAVALYRKFPLLAILRDFLLEHGALNAEITGSGPSMFAVCPSQEKRDALCRSLARSFRAMTLFVNEPAVSTEANII